MLAGIDIGGTKVAVCLARPGGAGAAPQILTRVHQPTARTGSEDALARQALALLDEACARQQVARTQLAGVGVSSCGPFAKRSGQIEVANPNICGGLAGAADGRQDNDWVQVPLQAPLARALGGTPLHIANDAVAALEAERRWGALAGVDDCAYVTWSTGVGVGLCVDGRVLAGRNGNAGHAGHTFVGDVAGSAPLCGCGNRGDVESLVGGGSLAARLGMEAPPLLAAAQQGDAQALEQVRGLCVLMGRLLYNLVATLDLARISLGGAVFLHHQALLLPLLREQLQRYFPLLTRGAELVPAGLGAQVGDYAALALLQERAAGTP
ncbi:sugar kinase [Pulveribacter suum]|uniref:Sugar kinase n=1 Tax=Pulveribacter suum TaxID=2116657 RepID=A0A2P1NPI4_9BURK|nr:ROK family protein [Pulveribacter suum]AVP58962.1 sugar kinase [Pulveribacter suum]